MADVALRPTFPPQELERLRQQRLVSLLQARDDAASIAGLAFSRVLYGASHRFGMATMGTARHDEGIHAGGSAGVLRAARTVPRTRRCIVVGDVTLDRVQPLLEAALRRLARDGAGRRRASRCPRRAPAPARAVYLIDKPGAPQSQIRIGRDRRAARRRPTSSRFR